MNPEVLETAKRLVLEIGRAKELSDTNNVNEIFLSAEFIIASLAYLISPLTQLETSYRELIVKYMDLEDSHAKAEAKAKASKEYQEWNKLKMLMELANSQIMILKKFRSNLEVEYKRR